MIEMKNVSFTHENTESPSLRNVSLTIERGACVLLCGESGSGKTTLTRLINGLIPHYYEGQLEGSVWVDGRNVTESELYETAKLVGSVFQNPRSQFFCVDTSSELAFGCENMGLPEAEIENRVEAAARELNIENLLGRSIFELSGGEKQKIACASVSALHPDVMVLDEPTSNLDIHAIGELKEILLQWKHAGKTIVIAEHRLHWLTELCDRVVCMEAGQIAFDMPMADFLRWTPEMLRRYGLRTLNMELPSKELEYSPEATMTLKDFSFSYDKENALSIDRLKLPVGGIIAVIGSNGAGKSTFSRCLCGLEKKFKGQLCVRGETWKRKQLLKKCYMVMQDVNHQLFCESVEDEVQLGIQEEMEQNVPALLEQLDLLGKKECHPMSLSGGEKQRVAIASALLAEKDILVFDEPTSGLDFKHMEQTASLLRSLLGKQTVFVVTHDPELISRCCSHVLHMDHGKANQVYPVDEAGLSRLKKTFLNL